jgi:hypothetical protein
MGRVAHILAITIGVGFAFSGQPASALVCGDADCDGQQGKLTGFENLKHGGDPAVLDWIGSEGGYAGGLDPAVDGPGWRFAAQDSKLVSSGLPPGSAIFLAKIGSGSGIAADPFCRSCTHVFIRNLNERAFAIIGLSKIGLKDIEAVSHHTSIVPLPAAAWLLISAIVALVAVGRIRRSGKDDREGRSVFRLPPDNRDDVRDGY